MKLSELALKIFWTAAILGLVALAGGAYLNSLPIQTLAGIIIGVAGISALVGIIAKIWEE